MSVLHREAGALRCKPRVPLPGTRMSISIKDMATWANLFNSPWTELLPVSGDNQSWRMLFLGVKNI